MSITFLLFLDHYVLKDEKKYTSGSEMEPIRKWSSHCTLAWRALERKQMVVHAHFNGCSAFVLQKQIIH